MSGLAFFIADFIASVIFSGESPSNPTVSFVVNKFTLADLTPSSDFTARSTFDAQTAQSSPSSLNVFVIVMYLGVIEFVDS
jgi:hypothetical protein